VRLWPKLGGRLEWRHPRRFGAGAAPAGGSGHGVMQRDSKRIARQWNREIEDELRREAARREASGPWKAVGWAGLWVLWLALLVALIVRTRALG